MKHFPRQSGRGFTFVEMLVVIALILLMMFLIYRLFFDSLEVISRGVALSNIHMSARTLGETVENDGKAMVGPGPLPAGMLVILQKEISAKSFPEDTAPRDVRSDQLMFIRRADGVGTVPAINAMVPADASTLVPADLPANFARIWYGHGQRTTRDGLDDGVLGAPGANQYASNWMLSRQALFFRRLLAPLPAAPRTAFAITDAPIVSGLPLGNGYPTAVAAQTGGSLRMYHGLNDFTAMTLSDVFNDPLYGVVVLVTGLLSYQDAVYPYTFSNERLRVNDRPLWDSNAGNYQYAYASWQFSQSHPAFIPHVSDFLVDFAGDYDGTSGIDKDGDGNIIWYSHYYNNPTEGRPSAPGAGNQDDSMPYTYAPPAIFVSSGWLLNAPRPIHDTSPGLANADAGIVFRHLDLLYWPHLVRMRARIHDANGKFKSTNRNITSGDASTPGVWYESIIQVNR